MRRSIWKAEGLLWLLAGLHTAALCRAGTSATPGSITIVPVGGTVRFPILHHSQERFEVAMGRIHPDPAILAWKSDSPEYPYMVRPSYRDRVRFRRDTFIELRAVTPGDHGTYEVQTNYLGRKLRNRDRERFELRVVEPMFTPTVEVSRNSSHLMLNCSTVSGCPVTYRWERRSQYPGVGNATFPGAVLYLPDPGHHTHTHTYTCIAEDCCSRRVSDAFPAMLLSVALPGDSRFTTEWRYLRQGPGVVGRSFSPCSFSLLPCWESGHRISAETVPNKERDSVRPGALQNADQCTWGGSQCTPSLDDGEHVCCCPISVADVSPLSMVPEPPLPDTVGACRGRGDHWTDEDYRRYEL